MKIHGECQSAEWSPTMRKKSWLKRGQEILRKNTEEQALVIARGEVTGPKKAKPSQKALAGHKPIRPHAKGGDRQARHVKNRQKNRSQQREAWI